MKLPSDIFKRLPNSDAANTVSVSAVLHPLVLKQSLQILKTVYLPEETLQWLGQLGKRIKSPTAVKVTFTHIGGLFRKLRARIFSHGRRENERRQFLQARQSKCIHPYFDGDPYN